MKTYIILSNRVWSKFLYQDLAKQIEANWIFIDDKNEVNFDYLSSLNPEYIFIPNWSHIIEEPIIRKFKCIVFHETDLPFGRGGSPIQNLIVKGYESTVVSAIRASENIDAGPIYLKKEVSLLGGIEEIFLRISNVVQEMIVEIISKNIDPVPQSGEGTIFKRRGPKDSLIKEFESIEKIFDKIRMLDSDYYPHAYFESEKLIFEFTRPTLRGNKTIIADVRIIKK
ncbi:formyltransferase family protein [Salegentibacter salarius]|uniref:Methionyl-tRNA formyltransferase n=1 Tax=Salegentibacter salarius TaxID=435906 RepID=A0A2N0U566_9FLAO|nr:formyltransferase family protein [Salegentibacter salarius]OEY73952.1 methionyl-tRNA formyltransferase [Salegentibacter salarius]PKD22152.1 methionyl-tRNA formyltransferase [Salegentibacter salarius]SLJ86317.1 methionyl-tRNA formyltransferase [Salegentibacter salarius]